MTKRYRNILNRRTFLRGAGATAIALPFLEEMTTRSLFAQPAGPPKRLYTVFFGLGIPSRLLDSDPFGGVLAPLAPFRTKLGAYRGIDMNCARNHRESPRATFTGFAGGSDSSTAGPSIDFVAREAIHGGRAPTKIQHLISGSIFRRNRLTRYAHSWNNEGTLVARPIERPTKLFEELFGSTPGDAPSGPADADASLHRRRSILDTVLEDYRFFASERGNLSAHSRARIEDHLARIREIERSLMAPGEGGTSVVSASTCEAPGAPEDPDLPYGGGDDGPTLQARRVDRQRRQLLELTALGLRCDLTRFGNFVLQSGGERFRLTGEWSAGEFGGRFDDSKPHHEYWHDGDTERVRPHMVFMMSQLAHLLGELDGDDAREENGRTVLENMLLLVGAEMNDNGGHNNDDVFHLVSGAAGALRTGGDVVDLNTSSVNVYNTCLRAIGVDRVIGDRGHYEAGALDAAMLA